MHVEAGLRSYRDDMPEERNRIETDRLSDAALRARRAAPATTSIDEGVAGTVHVTGDSLCDVLLALARPPARAREEGEYVLATVHRNYNTDAPERLGAVLACLGAARRGG